MLEGGRNIQLKGRQDLSVVTPTRAGASAVELHPEGKWSLGYSKSRAYTKGHLAHCFSYSELACSWWFSCPPHSPLKSHALLTKAFHLGLFVFGGGKMKEQQTNRISETVTVSDKSCYRKKTFLISFHVKDFCDEAEFAKFHIEESLRTPGKYWVKLSCTGVWAINTAQLMSFLNCSF